MNLDDRAIQAHRFNLDADELLALQLGKEPIEHAGLCPAIHARIDRVLVAEALGQGSPFAAVLSDKQNRVDHVEVLMRYVATLKGQVRLDASVLFGCEFHARSISTSVNRPLAHVQNDDLITSRISFPAYLGDMRSRDSRRLISPAAANKGDDVGDLLI